MDLNPPPLLLAPLLLTPPADNLVGLNFFVSESAVLCEFTPPADLRRIPFWLFFVLLGFFDLDFVKKSFLPTSAVDRGWC